LDPLHQKPDAPLRGTIMHKVFEQFIQEYPPSASIEDLREQLLQIADRVFEAEAPWPVAAILWRAKLDRIAPTFLHGEEQRQTAGQVIALEKLGSHLFADIGFTLTAKADRIDRSSDGSLLIYDYKTGAPPSKNQLQYFDKQLLLEAVLAEQGAFRSIGPATVAEVAHIGVGAQPKFEPVSLAPADIRQIRDELLQLISVYQSKTQGYTSRRAMAEMRFDGDYDHLARFGEWDESQDPVPEVVGK
ncbi:MAG: PD-(D/E)XK nuclease family protein, partial [Paracoccaceae bacterium]